MKRFIVTAGMPYGNKSLHFGHIGGVFVHADAFTRFLRGKYGAENVLFISGTDCYGSPITEDYRKKTASGDFSGTIEDFVQSNHEKQKAALDSFYISLDLFAASALGRAAEIHRETSSWFLERLHEKGRLKKLSSAQFYDPERGVFLNGRQVVGRCPVAGCRSEKGYADECDLGHQYLPGELLEPLSTLTGAAPELRETENFYIGIDEMRPLLKKWLEDFSARERTRPFSASSIAEFMEPPSIYCKRELLEDAALSMPAHEVCDEGKPSVKLVFKTLADREAACAALSGAGLRFRTGKTLVPFRLTGTADWGVPAPPLDGLSGRTLWVWPESLWAPISFTQAALERRGGAESWRDWWCSPDTTVVQFIGQDNVYFYGPAQTSLFMGMEEGLPCTDLVANNHILFFSKKAGSSSAVKPPAADELLAFYTPEQLRAHFLGLGLSIRSVGFQPKPFNADAKPGDQDPVLKEGSLFTNVLNRAARSCFYTAQKYFGGKLPPVSPSYQAIDISSKAVSDYEGLMERCEFHAVMNLLDGFIRDLNKTFSARMKEDDAGRIAPALADAFHNLRVATVLSHPVAPAGCEALAAYFNLEIDFFSWEHIGTPLDRLCGAGHSFIFLEPRVDFFSKHPSQLEG